MKKVVGLFMMTILMFVLAGCSTEGADSNFRLLISDAPADIADFVYLNVHLDKMRVFTEVDGEESFEERDIDATVDLTQLVGALSTEVLETELEPGVYTKIELHVASVEAATISDEEAVIMVPSNKLMITYTFKIVADEVTTFVFDINIVKKGPGNEYNLLPVIGESGVVGEDLEEEDVEEIEIEDVEPEETEEV